MNRHDEVLVVVPAHDERERLPRCLAALRLAARRCPLPVRLVVVLDACTDGSEAALGPDVQGVRVAGRNVGAARAAGVTAAGITGRTFLACTDADSEVSPTWLLDQLARDADVVVGTVRVRHWPSRALRDRHEQGYTEADGHRHVHGANLGISGAAYLRLGGFAPLRAHEDVDLVARAVAAGFRVDWTSRVLVHTSARTAGRAPDGFAAHLRSLAVAAR